MTENSRQHPEHLLLRTDILQSLGAPDTLGSLSNNDGGGDIRKRHLTSVSRVLIQTQLLQHNRTYSI